MRDDLRFVTRFESGKTHHPNKTSCFAFYIDWIRFNMSGPSHLNYCLARGHHFHELILIERTHTYLLWIFRHAFQRNHLDARHEAVADAISYSGQLACLQAEAEAVSTRNSNALRISRGKDMRWRQFSSYLNARWTSLKRQQTRVLQFPLGVKNVLLLFRN